MPRRTLPAHIRRSLNVGPMHSSCHWALYILLYMQCMEKTAHSTAFLVISHYKASNTTSPIIKWLTFAALLARSLARASLAFVSLRTRRLQSNLLHKYGMHYRCSAAHLYSFRFRCGGGGGSARRSCVFCSLT